MMIEIGHTYLDSKYRAHLITQRKGDVYSGVDGCPNWRKYGSLWDGGDDASDLIIDITDKVTLKLPEALIFVRENEDARIRAAHGATILRCVDGKIIDGDGDERMIINNLLTREYECWVEPQKPEPKYTVSGGFRLNGKIITNDEIAALLNRLDPE